jgi:biotin synthase
MPYFHFAKEIIDGNLISFEQAKTLINTSNERTFELLAAANLLKKTFKGKKIKLCAIVNAKSGKCSENCSFCAQSAHHQTNISTHPLLPKDEIIKAAKSAQNRMQATCFSIVTSGKSTKSKEEVETICQALDSINNETRLNRCVSLGTLTPDEIHKLKAHGLKRLHHNLETAESFFSKVCTTHSYQERLQTIKLAKQAGLEVCSGGIFGLGETLEQRLELAFALRELEVESVPINIINPIPGTPAAQNYKPMPALEVLRLIATYRFILAQADIGVFGGRERALQSLQPLMFIAGSNVTLVGDYLTTKGQPPEKDLQMISDLGLEIEGKC